MSFAKLVNLSLLGRLVTQLDDDPVYYGALAASIQFWSR
jgi:hypothetical protein